MSDKYQGSPGHAMVSTLLAALRTDTKTVRDENGDERLIVPEGYQIVDIDQWKPPPHIIATRTFHDGNSLAAYVNKFKYAGSLLIGDVDAPSLSVMIDYHDSPAIRGPTAHKAVWPMALAPEYLTWVNFSVKLHPQEDFVRHIEENFSEIVTPDSADLLELCRDFSALQEVNFKSSIRLQNGDREFGFSTKTHTDDKITVPNKLRLRFPIFNGEEAVEVEAFFRHRMSGGGLMLGYEMHRLEDVARGAFQLTCTRVADECGLPALFGKAL
jgi:hypothetical protein